MIAVSGESFDTEVRTSMEPVLVDFWGPRCAPCLELMPAVEEMAEEFDGRLKIVKVNATENRKLCIQLKVMGLPTFLLFAGGQELARKSGEVSALELRQWIAERLPGLVSAHERIGD